MAKDIGKGKAQKCLDAIKKTFGKAGHDTTDLILMEDFDGRPFTIMWESGPFEWPFGLSGGAVDVEATTLARDAAIEFGVKGPAPTVRSKAVKFPAGVLVEPVNSYSVGLYPA